MVKIKTKRNGLEVSTEKGPAFDLRLILKGLKPLPLRLRLQNREAGRRSVNQNGKDIDKTNRFRSDHARGALRMV